MLSSWWNRLVRREPPLIRTPSTGRPRTYSADSGYVYQYTFAGFRERRAGGARDVEYVFEITTGRAPAFPLVILLTERDLRASIARDRDLTASERYGVAKLALKRALDAFEHPAAIPPLLAPDADELAAIGEILDL